MSDMWDEFPDAPEAATAVAQPEQADPWDEFPDERGPVEPSYQTDGEKQRARMLEHYARPSLKEAWFPNVKAAGVRAATGVAAPMMRAIGAGQTADEMNRLSSAFEQAARERDETGMLPAAITRNVRGAAATLPSMVGAGLIGGPYAAIAMAAGQEADQSITKGRDAGLSGGKLAGYVATQGAIEGTIAAAFQRVGLGGLEKSLSGPVIASGMKQALKQAGITAIQELPEELLTELGHNVADAVSKVDPKALSKDSLWQTALDTTLQTLFMTGAVHAPRTAEAGLRGGWNPQVQPEATPQPAPIEAQPEAARDRRTPRSQAFAAKRQAEGMTQPEVVEQPPVPPREPAGGEVAPTETQAAVEPAKPKRPISRAEAAIHDYAKENDLDAEALVSAASDIHQGMKEETESRRAAKAMAHKLTGLSPADMARIVNKQGGDPASGRKLGGKTGRKMRKLDVVAERVVSAHPEVFGDVEDKARAVFDLMRQGKIEDARLDSPEVLRGAAEQVRQANPAVAETQKSFFDDFLGPPPKAGEQPSPAAQARGEFVQAVKDLLKPRKGVSASSMLDPELLDRIANLVTKAIKAGVATFGEFLQGVRAAYGAKETARLTPAIRAEWEKQRGLVRPELAIPGTDPNARTTVSDVDKQRAAQGKPEVVHDEAVSAEAAVRMEADSEGERANLIKKGESGGQLDDVETVIAHEIINKAGAEAIASGDQAKITEAMRIIEAYRETGKEQSKAFRQRRDRVENPEQRMKRAINEAILEPPKKQREARGKARREGNNGEADRINADWAKKMEEMKAKLKARGIDIDNLNETGYTPRKGAEILRAVSQIKADRWDKMYEYWLNAILSAPTTQAANIIGNVGHAAWSMTAERFVEASINAGAGRPEAAQMGEFKYLLAGILPGISRGARNFVKAWATESPALEAEIHREGVTKIEDKQTAVGGETGRTIRAPTRLLGAVDDFAKSVIAEMEAGARAYRIAKAEGLSGEEMQARIEELTQDTSSPAWDAAYDSAKELSFQQEGGKTVKSVKQHVLAAREDLPGLRYLLPFVTTPINIFGTGVRKTPLGSLGVAKRMYDNYKSEKPILEGLPKYLAEQAIAWGVVAALLANGDDDPWITGSKNTWGSSREVGYRTFPPNSVKIGGKWYSYSRIEPFATALGLAVDWTGALRSGNAKRMASAPVDSFVGQLGTKTFLSGIGALVEAVDSESPAEGLAKWGSNFSTSFVPNIAKAASREADNEYMNRRVWGTGADWAKTLGKRTLQKTELTAIKDYPLYDVWGRPAQRSDSPVGSDWLWRVTVPVKVQEENVFKADRALINWNNQHPDDQAVFPIAPSPYYTKNGKRTAMTDEQYADSSRRSGEMAVKRIGNMSRLNPDNPTKFHIDLIKKQVEESREIVRLQMFGGQRR